MREMIAYCGLDCEKCDAYLATINDDQALREKTAKLWTALNNAPILPEHINCRALEKAGFRYEGTMKNNAVKNGKVLDMVLYSMTRTTEAYPVRRLTSEEIPQALELCWRVFLEFEAPEYSQEGIDHFRTSLEDQERIRKLNFYGAFDGDKLVGTLCMRALQHIGGFFVDASYHRRGIGRRLFEAMRRDYAHQVFTVNYSPYAVEVYRHLGFFDWGALVCAVMCILIREMPVLPSERDYG